MSWEQLKTILEENRERKRRAESVPPAACPIDGKLLDVHPDGRRNCPLGNYRWNGVDGMGSGG